MSSLNQEVCVFENHAVAHFLSSNQLVIVKMVIVNYYCTEGAGHDWVEKSPKWKVCLRCGKTNRIDVPDNRPQRLR